MFDNAFRPYPSITHESFSCQPRRREKEEQEQDREKLPFDAPHDTTLAVLVIKTLASTFANLFGP
jgi:hypothetical protein